MRCKGQAYGNLMDRLWRQAVIYDDQAVIVWNQFQIGYKNKIELFL